VVALACWRCLWYGTFGRRHVQVVLVRPPGRVDGYDLALVATDLAATPAELVERYADRWSVEVGFEEARQVAGVGQARNRTRLAVERTVPFGLVCLSLTVLWYALHGQPAVDIAARRAAAPWYQTKHAPSVADMLAALRRVLIAAQFCHLGRWSPPTRKSSPCSMPGLPQPPEPRKSRPYRARLKDRALLPSGPPALRPLADALIPDRMPAGPGLARDGIDDTARGALTPVRPRRAAGL
jgi:hypothetical protein